MAKVKLHLLPFCVVLLSLCGSWECLILTLGFWDFLNGILLMASC